MDISGINTGTLGLGGGTAGPATPGSIMSAGSTQQKLQFIETICEGPIKGLTEGAKSVYFNNVSALYEDQGEFIETGGNNGTNDPGTFLGLANFTFTGSSTTGTIQTGRTVPSAAIGNYSGATRLDHMYLQIEVNSLSNVTVSALGSDTVSNGQVTKNITVSNAAFDGTFLSKKGFDTEVGTQAPVVAMSTGDGGTAINGRYITFTDNGDGTASIGYPARHALLQVNDTVNLSVIIQSSATNVTSSTIVVRSDSNPTAGTYAIKLYKLVIEVDVGIGTSVLPEANNAKTAGLNVQFRDGSLIQNPIAVWDGAGGGLNLPATSNPSTSELKQLTSSAASSQGLTLYSTSRYPTGQSNSQDGANNPVIIGSGLWSGAQQTLVREQADSIEFEVRYPRLQSTDFDDGDDSYNAAIYSLDIRFKDTSLSDFSSYETIQGNITHQGNFGAPISWSIYVDLEHFRKARGGFYDFEIRLARLTRHTGERVMFDGSDHNEVDRFKAGDSTATVRNIIASVKDKLYYPYTAHAGISFNTQEFTSLPKISYDLQGKLVKIPSSYTPREYSDETDSSGNPKAKYTDFWDGSFQTGYYTDNPAWVFYDMLTNKRYGLGQYISEDDIDKYALYRIARYCDELVDDGNGGVEPRFRANIFLTKATQAYKVIKDMATIFRGILYWMDSQLTPVPDTPAEPVANFSKANVIEGVFSYQSSSNRTKINQVVVTWNDPDINFEPVPLIVEDRNAIVKDGEVNSMPAVAFGCTSEGQAIRYGRWKLWTAQNQSEIVSFQTGLQGGYLRPGDVINISDADRFGKSIAGRTKSSTNNTITLDRSVDILSNTDYKLNILVTEPAAYTSAEVTIGGTTYSAGDRIPQAYVKLTNGVPAAAGTFTLTDIDTKEKASNAYTASSNGDLIALTFKPHTHVRSYDVTTGAGTVSTLTISGTFDDNPVAETVWALTETFTNIETFNSAKQYKVLSIAEAQDNIYEISAIEYYDEKYTAIEQDYELGIIPDNIFLPENENSIPKPKYVTASENINSGLTPGRTLTVRWEAPEDFAFTTGFEIRHNLPKRESPIRVGAEQTSLDLTGVPDGVYKFDVRTLSFRGNASRWKTTYCEVLTQGSGTTLRIADMFAGGTSSANAFVKDTLADGAEFVFASNEYTLAPPQKIGENKTNDSTNTLSTEQDVGRLAGAAFSATSTTTNTIGTGERTFTLSAVNTKFQQTGLAVTVYDANNSNNFMFGTITSYSGASITIDVTNTGGSGTRTSWSILRFGGFQSEAWAYETNTSDLPLAYIFVDTSEVGDGSSDCLKLVSRKETDGVIFFQDVYASSPYTTSRSGTVDVDAFSSRVVGNASTLFKTELNVGDVIKFADDKAAIVTYILSNRIAFIDRVFETDITNTSFNVNSLQINRKEDFILGAVTYDSSSDEFAFEQLFTIDPDLLANKQLLLDSDTAFLAYNLLDNADQHPDTLSVRATAIGYTEPEFQMTWTSSDLTGGDSSDTTFNAGNYPTGSLSSGFKQQYEKTVFDEDTPIAYGDGTVIQVSCTVREKSDPENTKKQRTATWNFVRIRSQAEGSLARVVKLTAEDYSIIYNAQGTTPVYNGSSDNDVDLTAAVGSFNDALFRYTLDGTVYQHTSGQDWSENTTAPYSVPSNISSFGNNGGSKIMLVEVAEKPSGWNQSAQTPAIADSDILASDSISIVAIKTGGTGTTIVFTNETHAVACDKDGEPLVGYNTNLTGSGTKIEVYHNGVQYDFTTSTPGNEQFGVAIANNADIIEGSISGNGTDTATVADHQFGANSEDQETLEYTITVGGIALDGSNVDFTKFQTFAKSKQGNNGAAGSSAALVYLYKASASAPSLPGSSFDPVVVDLSTGLIDTSGGSTKFEDGDAGWYKSPNGPTLSSGLKLWVIAATANGTGTSDEILYSEWAGPAQFSGEEGLNAATVELFLVNNSGTTPSKPDTDVTYTFSTGAITGTPGNSWTTTPDSVTALNPYLWKCTAAAIGTGTTVTIDGDGDPNDWSTPVVVGYFGDTGSAGVDAAAVKLTSTDYSIQYDASDNPTPSGTLTLTATAQNVTSPRFKFTGDGFTDDTDFETASTKTYTIPSSSFTNNNIRVGVAAAADTSTELAFDTITIIGVTAGETGEDAFSVSNPNSSHTIPSDSDGNNEDFTGSGTTLEVFKGATELTNVSGTPGSGEYSVTATATSVTKGTETVGGGSNNKKFVMGDITAMSADTGKIVYSINIENSATLSSQQSFSKSKDGATGDPGDNVAQVQIYIRTSSSTAPSVPNSNETFNFGSGRITSTPISSASGNWSESVPSGTGQYLWTCKASAIGAEGATTATLTAGLQSASGSWSAPVLQSEAQQPRRHTANAYYDAWTVGDSKPSIAVNNITYSFSTKTLGNLPSGWSTTIPTDAQFAGVVLTVQEASFGGSVTITAGEVYTVFVPNIFAITPASDFEIDFNALDGLRFSTDGGSSFTNTGSLPDGVKNASITSSDISGTGKVFSTLPESGATVGAQLGTNLLDTDGATNLSETAVKNSQITLNASGYLNNIGTTQVLSNANIVQADLVGSGKTFAHKPNKTTFSDNTTEGIFSFEIDEGGSTDVNVFSSSARTQINNLRNGKNPDNQNQSILNNEIQISSAGVLSGAGGGTVSASGIGAVQTSLANAPDAIKNDQISINDDGTLEGAGGGGIFGAPTIGANTSAIKVYDDAIKIFAGGVLRVKIGNLGNTTDD